VTPNKSLQRSWTHKVLGRGRPSKSAHERYRARVLKCRRAAAELSRYAALIARCWRMKEISKLVFVAAIATWLFALPVRAEDMPFYSYAFAKQYMSVVTDDALEKSPAWKKDEPNPPISARRAIELADQMKASLDEHVKDFEWQFRSASLESAASFSKIKDRWYWQVYYECLYTKGTSTGIPNNLRLFILMDGTVIKPVIKPYPR